MGERMANKDKISDWDSTPANNTDVGGVAITGAASVRLGNDAIQTMMAQTADLNASDTIASASTTDLGTKAAQYLQITGTTTITAFGTVKAGIVKIVEFAGTLTLTHNGTSLILPGAANITTAAGDTAVMVSEGSGNWRCAHYQRASGGIISAATQAQMEAASSLTVPVTPGRQQFHPSAAKGWCKCDSAGNNSASYNVTSVSDTGTGQATVTWDVDFSSSQYCVVASIEIASSGYLSSVANATAVGATTVQCFNPGVGRVDPSNYFVVAFGDQ